MGPRIHSETAIYCFIVENSSILITRRGELIV